MDDLLYGAHLAGLPTGGDLDFVVFPDFPASKAIKSRAHMLFRVFTAHGARLLIAGSDREERR